MRHATSRELYAYWDRIRGAELAPRRSDVEPGDIRRVLPDTFILEVVGREDYLVRLAGTRMCSLYGREIKGTGFLDLWTREDRETIASVGTSVSEDAAGVVNWPPPAAAPSRVNFCSCRSATAKRRATASLAVAPPTAGPTGSELIRSSASEYWPSS